jgi:hypothetical protein
MALALDGTADTQTATAATSITGHAFSTTNAGDIVIVMAMIETSPETGDGYPWSAPTCTGGGLTFAVRKRALYAATSSDVGHVECVIFWAYASSAVSAPSGFTVSWAGTGLANPDDLAMIVFAVTGFTGTTYHTAPWDSNVSLPASNSTGSAGGAPTVTGVSTTSTASMLISLVASADTGAYSTGTQPSGWTFIANANNPGGTNAAEVAGAFDVVAAAQSSISVAWSASPGNSNWGIIADALAQAGGSLPPAATPYNPWPLWAPLLSQ